MDGSPWPLVAELLEVGRIRLHLEREIRPHIQALADELSADGSRESIEKLAVLQDRYRTVQLYIAKSDFRVRLVPAVLAYLSVQPEDNRTVYVEGRPDLVDIMSLKARNARLETLTGISSL